MPVNRTPNNMQRRNIRTNTSASKGKGKQPLPDPTHLGHFVLIVIMTICRKVLLIDTSVKVGIYLVGVMLGSILSDLFVFPKSYFSDKHNVLNEYFVKLGWGWTFVLLGLFMFMTSFVYCCGDMKRVGRHMVRLCVATFWWYSVTTFFNKIENLTGYCTERTYMDKQSCIKGGRGWLGFDISGHAFLLIHNLLTMSEEVKCFKEWKKLDEILNNNNEMTYLEHLTGSEVSQGKISFKSLSPFIKLNFIALALLAILWEVMLLITTIYRFHTLVQKVVAAFVAVGCWFISYQVLFPMKFAWCPGLSGDSKLKYTKAILKR